MAALTMPIYSVMTVRHEYLLGSDVSYNVLHYQLVNATVDATGLPMATDPIAKSVLLAMAPTLYTNWANAWDDMASEDLTYTSLSVKKTYPGDKSPLYTYVPTVAAIGSQASESLPLQDCVTILKKTDFGGRWGMGRVFLSGIPEAMQADGVVDAAYPAALSAIVNVIGSDVTASDGTNTYVIRPVVTNMPGASYPRINYVTDVNLSDRVLKTQRRRRPGKGI